MSHIHKMAVGIVDEFTAIPGKPVYFIANGPGRPLTVWYDTSYPETRVRIVMTGEEFNGEHLFTTISDYYVLHLIKHVATKRPY